MVKVMAIVNITPDSFWEGSRNVAIKDIERRVVQAVREGASILDLGGYSTRPGAADVSLEEELSRLDSAFEVIRCSGLSEVEISVDTFRSQVVEKIYDKWGRFIVNDISAGRLDAGMIGLVGRLGLPYIAMHSRANPATMQSMTDYEDVVSEVSEFLRAKIAECRAAGISDITVDPGFGFAKTLPQNYELLRGLHRVCELGVPVLAGLSRKSMIWRTLGVTPDEALNGTTALNWEALRQGATVLRVHDVRAAVEVVEIYTTFTEGIVIS
ncbi:Dihydropteroate synthase [Mucinivorans hirudinis]|uniref:dihydropteroate synthase n=1 Tax=Mucinivorans hirudinis TaxID=1433126 RepID=A0A060R9Z1_9BACT|nr:Dihydropteroate synthase [Mucinivorans hirudinis]